ncbi:MAG: hypothetical protein HQM11_00420 [SAR324 cluster bacterium]|nr:hypothetical protein [SAR324 cluster bacterium]
MAIFNPMNADKFLKRFALCFMVIGFCATPPLHALEWTASFRSMAARQTDDAENSFWWNRLRLQANHEVSADCLMEMAYELRPVWANHLQQLSSFFSVESDSSSIYRFDDLNNPVYPTADTLENTDDAHLLLTQNLDRMLLACHAGNLDVTLGRQTVAFGGAQTINPTDVFVPLRFNSLDGEYRVGVDALRMVWGISPTTEMDVGYLLGKNGNSENNGAYARLHFVVESTDITPMLALFREHQMLGLSLQTALPGDVGLVFDGGSFFLKEEEHPFSLWTLGFNYQWNEDWFTALEYHRNEAGVNKPANYFQNTGSYRYQQTPISLMGPSYLIPVLSYQIHPLWNASASLFLNLADHSALISPQLEWSADENVMVEWGGFLAQGLSSGDPLNPKSEFGESENLIFMAIRYYL